MKFQFAMNDNHDNDDNDDNDDDDNNHEEIGNGNENRKKKTDDIPRDFSRLQAAGVKDDNEDNKKVIWSCPVCGVQFNSDSAYSAHLPCRGGGS